MEKHCVKCQKKEEVIKTSIIGKTNFHALSCKHIVTEKIEKTRLQYFEMVANDLMKYHGLEGRFNILFDGRKDSTLGTCKVGVKGEGIIWGTIILNKKHVENDPEKDVIDTILHEISHAITPGAGHTPIWIATDLSIGGNGQARAWCEGTTKVLYKVCPVCHKKAEEISHEIDEEANIRRIFLICGHSYEEKLSEKIDTTWTFEDGRKPYDYQYEGIDFARKSGFRCGIFDEMGLGKTIQGIGVLFKFPETLPALIVCKANVYYNWIREYHLSTNGYVQPLETGSQRSPMFPVHIITFDTLARVKNLDDWKYQTIIVDECQQIKNHDAKRTNALRKVCKNAVNVLALSGTPIKNNAGEYFPILNILRPEIFPSFVHFHRHHVYSGYSYGRVVSGGLMDPERFHKLTEDFLIRRTRKEVLPDLPEIQRDYKFFQLGETVKAAYKKELENFNDFYLNQDQDVNDKNQMNILAYMTKMRHITGFAKIQPVLEYIEEYLEGKNGEAKLAVFHHHIDVADWLCKLLEEKNISFVRMTSADDKLKRFEKVDQFRDEKTILVAPTLACGEGINLQFCQDAIMMEREWNPANEEQVEGRFSRIGSMATAINAMYPTGIGTIDEYFAKIVERKRQIIEEANTGKRSEVQWDQKGIMKELADALFKYGMRGWQAEN